ncbi:hybrid sensor histidine kinase/response regulator [Aspergillus stella-maris]|uniref:hybrid sensor histidine kinase/response regulator n=1 Tax=Aspergillus stella-maris TaxID=1810926 RepID=UPI003CCE42C2
MLIDEPRYLPRDHTTYPFAPVDEAGYKNFVPVPSRDNALTSFAQLGASRLHAERAVISLFGPTHQYVLAEGAQLPGPDGEDELRLGCCILPRESGVCMEVANLPLSEPSDNPAIVGRDAIVISDMRAQNLTNLTSPIKNILRASFWTGVPIISPAGTTIGSYCVFGSQPRQSGIDEVSINFMKCMATTTMAHLDGVQSKHRNDLANKMIFGLGSFVEGKTTLRDSWLEAQEQDAATVQSGETVEGQLNKRQQDVQKSRKKENSPRLSQQRAVTQGVVAKGPSLVADTTREAAEKHQNLIHTQTKAAFRTSHTDDKLPEDSTEIALEKTFSRAANLIRESLEVEGVIFLDARIESFGGLVGYRNTQNSTSESETGSAEGSSDAESTSLSSRSCSSPPISGTKTTTCQILGSSTSKSSTINDDSMSKPDSANHYVMGESALNALLNRYPRGKIFDYSSSEPISDDSGTSGSPATTETAASKGRRKKTKKQDAQDLSRMLGGVQSLMFLPLWDSHKARWLSGALVWTKTRGRFFTPETELTYLHAFGNSIMAGVHQLDVELAEKAKRNLVTNISHELRSPLHGILGTADILSDTVMNALQQGMVHTIEACGRTLLDTINNLLDFTYIDKFRREPKQKYKHGRRKVNLGHSREESGRFDKSIAVGDEDICEDVQLDAVLEEVVESVFSGHSFYYSPGEQDEGSSTNEADSPLNDVTLIFDIQEAADWKFSTPAGPWRRIMMNVFSNALKYTPRGFIYLGLKASNPQCDSEGSQTQVTFTVKDTGQGMGVEFLRDGLYTPFSQEDSLAPGSGLGLSIVRKSLVALHGTIEVTSEKGKGTQVSIQAPMSLASAPNKADESHLAATYSLVRRQAEGKTIGLIGFHAASPPDPDFTLFQSLQRLCEGWFGLTVHMASSQNELPTCDFYLTASSETDDVETEGLQGLGIDAADTLSPLIVICQTPKATHNIHVDPGSSRRQLNYVCSEFKELRPKKPESTRWVEIPESSHMSLDIGPRNSPGGRMKISKRTASLPYRRKRTEMPATTAETFQTEGARPQPDLKAAGGRPSVLLVEDNPVNLKILIAYVKKENWDCETATNGIQAVQAFQTQPGRFPLVIMDISMPVMDGFTASRKIREIEQGQPAVRNSGNRSQSTLIAALTALDNADAQKEAFASGIDEFFTKPIDRSAVRSLLQRFTV